MVYPRRRGTMSKPLKVILIVLGVLVALGVAVVGGLVWWFWSNQEEFVRMADEARAEGHQFGSTTTGPGCVDEGLRRIEACGNLVCEVRISAFLRFCLQSAKVDPGFCAEVPIKSSIMETAMWRVNLCHAKGATNVERCGRMLDAVQKYCHEPRLEAPSG